MLLKEHSESTLLSPIINRTSRFPSLCFKFRYMMFGKGSMSLRVSVKTSYKDAIIPVWIDEDNTKLEWKYGEIPVRSMVPYQIQIRGTIDRLPGAIALGYAYMENDICEGKSSYRWKTVCSKNLTTAPGYIASPFYPTYYVNNLRCSWHINAPGDHVIRLTFLDFMLEQQNMCSYDFVQIYDGEQQPSSSLGKFCGYMYTEFVESSSNLMTVIFHSDLSLVQTGFKAMFTFISVKHRGKICRKSSAGCPSSCTCLPISIEKGIDRIVIKSRELKHLPEKMPTETSALMLKNNRINIIENTAFADISNLLYIDLSSNRIFLIKPKAFTNGSSIEYIRLNNNFLKDIPPEVFQTLINLNTLDLGKNLLQNVTGRLTGLTNLNVLSLRSNRISRLSSDVFQYTTNLTHFYLQNNNISSLPDGIFRFLNQLLLLNLAKNKIKHVRKDTFEGLTSLKHLNLKGNKLSRIPQDTFDGLQDLETLQLDKFIHCCYAKKSIPNLKCEASASNEFSSCDDLMKSQTLKVFIWILGISALIGNLLVIGKRVCDKDAENNTHSFLLTNLAVADFLMGLNLIIIASVDMKWRGEYFKHDEEWRSGVGCQITGVISMVSSEVSVGMLTVITYDRLICIVFPFAVKKINKRMAMMICACVWTIGLVVSIIPLLGLDYFNDHDDTDFGFYGRSSVCLSIQLSSDLPSGWEYSIAIFLVINFMAFTFMLIAYIAIFIKVRRSSRAVRSTATNRESSLAKRVTFIILTDFLCWMPVIVIALLSITKTYNDPTKQVYVWIAVFVLPINSSINPFLYTFSTLRKRKKSTAETASSEKGKTKREKERSLLPTTVESLANKDVDKTTTDKKQEMRTSEQIKYNIQLLEKLEIPKLGDGIGFVLADVESNGSSECCLIKYFSPDRKDIWTRELKMISLLEIYKDGDGSECVIKHRWHCLANEYSSKEKCVKGTDMKNAALICYEHVPNKLLYDCLEDENVLNFRVVCLMCIDIISAIDYLQRCGISNNNINIKTIVVRGSDSMSDPLRAVLVDFSKANELRVYDNGSYVRSDIIQFARLFKTLLKSCKEFTDYEQVNEVLSLCDKERSKNTAIAIKNILLEAKRTSEEAEVTHEFLK